MEFKRVATFHTALEALRIELRDGRHPPDTRLTAGSIAERLSLSATPVREALSRLAGDGLLIDRRGQGYFVPRLSQLDVEGLFRMQLAVLKIASGSYRGLAPLQASPWSAGAQPSVTPDSLAFVGASEQLFRRLTQRAGPALMRHLLRLQDQLAPVRKLEPTILAGMAEEFSGLVAAIENDDRENLEGSLEEFHHRRIEIAGDLTRARDTENIDPI